MEIFPKVNAGEFQLRLRGPDGTRIEVTEELASQAIRIIQDETRAETGADQVAISVGYYGLHPTSYTINNMYLWMRGPEEAVLRVGLKKGSGLDIDRLKERLRESLPRRLGEWYRQRLGREGLPEETVAQRLRGLRFSFEPADIVNQIMSFGSPTPIEISVSGPNFADDQAHAQKVFEALCQDSVVARPSVRAVARLPGGGREDRPRKSRPERRDRGGRGPVAGFGDVVQPIRRAHLLGRSRARALAITRRSRSRRTG